MVLVGGAAWDPAVVARAAAPPRRADPTGAERHVLWRAALNGGDPDGFDPAATVAFRLAPEQIRRAARRPPAPPTPPGRA